MIGPNTNEPVSYQAVCEISGAAFKDSSQTMAAFARNVHEDQHQVLPSAEEVDADG